MATFTENYDFEKPTPNDPATEDTWGGTLNANLDAIDAAITTAALHKVALYHWTRSGNAGRWESYGINITDEGGQLRATNIAGPGDGAIYLSVPTARLIIVRAQPSSASGMAQSSVLMHLGNAAEGYGGYGFSYAMGEDHSLTTTDETLVIYLETTEGVASDWVEFSDITVDLVDSGQRITASATPPPSPGPGDVWIDIS